MLQLALGFKAWQPAAAAAMAQRPDGSTAGQVTFETRYSKRQLPLLGADQLR